MKRANILLSLIVLLFSATSSGAAPQDAASDRFKRRADSVSENGPGVNTNSAARAEAIKALDEEGEDRAAKWYAKRRETAGGGDSNAARRGDDGLTADQRRDYRSRVNRDARYRAAMVNYLMSMQMLQRSIINFGSGVSGTMADNMKSRERQVGNMRSRQQERSRQDRIYGDRIHEQNRRRRN